MPNLQEFQKIENKNIDEENVQKYSVLRVNDKRKLQNMFEIFEFRA